MSLISFTPLQDGVTGVNASATNNPLNTIYNDYNGNITDANIASGAAIAGSKIAYASVANPYKFSVYRNSAFSTGNGVFQLVSYDTKIFDTGTNIDVVTNKGRFTAPIAGFWQFNASLDSSTSSTALLVLALYKNGTEYSRGSRIQGPGANSVGAVYSGLIQLSAGDYVEMFTYSNAAITLEVGAASPHPEFNGFLVSAT